MVYRHVMGSGSHIAVRAGFVIILIAVGLHADPVHADVATSSPDHIGFFCPPYTESIAEGGYYTFTFDASCTYIAGTVPVTSSVRYGGVFRGTLGSSTVMNAHSLGITGVSSQSNDFPSTRQPPLTQGEPLFAAIWRLPLGPAFNGYNPVFISFFTTGATPPPSNDYGFIQWKWGVNPGPAPCTLNCYSNVLFIPGIEASRLYRPDGSGGESRIWEPSFTGHDNTQLAMTTSGASVLPDIYTKDVLDRTLGVDVYDSFLSTMRDFSAQNGIQFDTFPYDWRHAADYVAANPAQLATTTIALADKVKALAASSKSGKVTIIAHSNGGLVARSLMAQLGPDAARYVDKLIFVAVPQVGTPQAIAGLLHGYNEAIPVSWAPLLISDSEARTLGSNMPGAYGLLPSAEYFSSVSTPVITFSTSTLPDWVSAYGESINTVAGLDAFLTDNAGRTQPVESDLNDPTILSSGLLSQSQAMHQTIDAWVPPPGVELIQIAGWGIPTTVSGISYGKKNGNIEPAANFTIDGDGTVVVPSALWTSTTTGAEDYWVNFAKYNRLTNRLANGRLLGVGHADILSVREVEQFILDKISATDRPLFDYIYLSDTAPTSNDVRLVYSLHSPLTFDLYDDYGNHTGMSTTTNQVEEQIPGTYYTEFGDVKYIFSDAGAPAHIVMNGYDTGTFTLDVTQLQGDTEISHTSFADLPTTPQTNVQLDVQSDITTLSPMRIDKDSDGVTDTYVAPNGGTLSIDELLTNLTTEVQGLTIKDKLKNQLLNKISAIQKKIDKRKQKQSNVLALLQAQVQKKADKGKIDAASAEQISALLDELLAQSATIPLDPVLIGQLKDQLNALTATQSLKNRLLAKANQLENLVSITRSLANFTEIIGKKRAKGRIPDADVQNILSILDQLR